MHHHLRTNPTLNTSNQALRLTRLLRWTTLACAVAGSLPWPAQAVQIAGLQSPNSFVGDSLGQEYFISNVNGEPDDRDNNGFITKLDRDGKITSLKFIQGGVDNVVLHAPKGLAL